MFRELGKLKDAERLLKERKFGEVLALVRDPEVRDHKRAHDARVAARAALLEEAQADLAAGRLPAAGQKVRIALDDGDDPPARELHAKIRDAATRAESEAKAAQRALREARWHEEHGDRGRARRLVEPFAVPEVATFIRTLDEAELAERKAKDAVLEAVAAGASPDGLRARLRELRQAVRDPKILAEVHARALDAAAARRDPAELASLIRDVRAAGLDLGEPLDLAAAALVEATKSRLERGAAPAAVAEALLVFPAGCAADPDGVRLKLACWAESRARAMAARGHERLAVELLTEAAAGLPPAAAARPEDLAATARKVGGVLEEVERLARAGDWAKARATLAAAARTEPDALVLHDWCDALEACAGEWETLRAEARAALDAGDLRKARRVALRLRLRGARSAEAAPLLEEIAREDEGAQRKALESERQVLRRGGAGPFLAGAASRPEPMPDFSMTPSLILPGDPFVLRVENEGDWFVHPAARLTIGNQANGEADLQVLAAIGAKHATIERTERDGAASWRLVAAQGQRVLRNGKQITESPLENGDRVQLGHALTFTFHRPSPDNSTAAIRLHGDFAVQGCTRIVLFCESGRKGSILLAPGSDGHVPLRSIDARLEVFRAAEGEDAGELFARSALGVAAGDSPERAQVRVRASQALSVGALRVHVDAAGKERRRARE
jgi:hypothetical protein